MKKSEEKRRWRAPHSKTLRAWRLFAWLALLGLCPALRAAQVSVFAAVSLSESLQEISAAYEKQSSDRILFNFGASSGLARQIEAGAPADIFFSADEAQMDGIEKKGLTDHASRKDLLGNSLVVVIPIDSEMRIQSAKDLTEARVKRLALADPTAVPAGVYAKRWLEQLKLWPAVAPKVIPVENVRAALAAVESGNVDAAVVYKTDAGVSKKVKVAFEAPGAEAPKIVYPAALLKDAASAQAARKFLDYLAGSDAAAVFARRGFIVLSDAGKR